MWANRGLTNDTTVEEMFVKLTWREGKRGSREVRRAGRMFPLSFSLSSSPRVYARSSPRREGDSEEKWHQSHLSLAVA